jgi:hypothetical protein
MKRLLVFVLAVLYLAAGAGFTLREHYCMGERVGAELSHPAQRADGHRCARCGMDKKANDGCCKDDVKILKCCPDQTVAEMPVLHAPVLLALAPVAPLIPASAAFREAAEEAAPVHGPPLSEGPPRYLRLRRLLI